MRNIPFEKLDYISMVLKTISHPIRLKIIEALENKDRLNVQDISKYIGDHVEQSLLSHHLIKMKDKGILECHKEGQFVFYRLMIKEVVSLLDCMENCKIKK
jgi:DNA-binding transcriptional ArsR family regulator